MKPYIIEAVGFSISCFQRMQLGQVTMWKTTWVNTAISQSLLANSFHLKRKGDGAFETFHVLHCGLPQLPNPCSISVPETSRMDTYVQQKGMKVLPHACHDITYMKKYIHIMYVYIYIYIWNFSQVTPYSFCTFSPHIPLPECQVPRTKPSSWL